jgi:hypothetical protein
LQRTTRIGIGISAKRDHRAAPNRKLTAMPAMMLRLRTIETTAADGGNGAIEPDDRAIEGDTGDASHQPDLGGGAAEADREAEQADLQEHPACGLGSGSNPAVPQTPSV